MARGQRISSGVSQPTAFSPGFMWKDEPHPSPFLFLRFYDTFSEAGKSSERQTGNFECCAEFKERKEQQSKPQRHSVADLFSCKA